VFEERFHYGIIPVEELCERGEEMWRALHLDISEIMIKNIKYVRKFINLRSFGHLVKIV